MVHIEYAEYAEYLPIVFLVQLELAIGHGPRWVCSMYVLCTYIEHALQFFKGRIMVFHGFWLVSMFFKVVSCFFMVFG